MAIKKVANLYQSFHQLGLLLRVRLVSVLVQHPVPDVKVAGPGHAVRVDELPVVCLDWYSLFTPPFLYRKKQLKLKISTKNFTVKDSTT